MRFPLLLHQCRIFSVELCVGDGQCASGQTCRASCMSELLPILYDGHAHKWGRQRGRSYLQDRAYPEGSCTLGGLANLVERGLWYGEKHESPECS